MSLLFLLPNAINASHWYTEYWQFFNWQNWASGPYRLCTRLEIHMNRNNSQFYFYRLSENFAYRVSKYLDVEAHYTFLYHKPWTETSFTRAHILELEINPNFDLGNKICLRCRNRLEFIKIPDTWELQYLFRQRNMLVFPVEWGKLKAVRIHDESFYNFNMNKYIQNRFAPLELFFEFNKRVNFAVFIMLEWGFRANLNKWERMFVLGTDLAF